MRQFHKSRLVQLQGSRYMTVSNSWNPRNIKGWKKHQACFFVHLHILQMRKAALLAQGRVNLKAEFGFVQECTLQADPASMQHLYVGFICKMG